MNRSNSRDLLRAKKVADQERRRIRNLARVFAAESLEGVNGPHWMEQKGITRYADQMAFEAEVKRIAARIRKTITD